MSLLISIAHVIEYDIVGTNKRISSNFATTPGGGKSFVCGMEDFKGGLEDYLNIKYLCLVKSRFLFDYIPSYDNTY